VTWNQAASRFLQDAVESMKDNLNFPVRILLFHPPIFNRQTAIPQEAPGYDKTDQSPEA